MAIGKVGMFGKAISSHVLNKCERLLGKFIGLGGKSSNSVRSSVRYKHEDINEFAFNSPEAPTTRTEKSLLEHVRVGRGCKVLWSG